MISTRVTRLKAALAATLCALALAACAGGGRSLTGQTAAHPAPESSSRAAAERGARSSYGPSVLLAHLEDKTINESSGLAASRLAPGIFWTHNDSSDGPFVYAFDRQGRSRGRWRVTGASARDWEDMAAGPGPQQGRPYLYVGDIGDNRGVRDQLVVYRFPEPAVADSAGDDPISTEPAESVTLKYPDGRYDAETLMVHPRTGDIYVITKTGFAAAGVYKLAAPQPFSGAHKLRRVGSVSGPGLFGGVFTGGDISPDGRRAVLCDYSAAYELELPNEDSDFDRLWAQPLAPVALGQRRQGEAVCYSHDGSSILATSEKRPTPLIEVARTGRQR